MGVSSSDNVQTTRARGASTGFISCGRVSPLKSAKSIKEASLMRIDESPVDMEKVINQNDSAIAINGESETPPRSKRTARVYSFDGDVQLVSGKKQEVVEQQLSTRRSAHKESSVNEKFCRICFEGEEDVTKGFLICPCRCDGSLKHIHEECLKTWLVQRDSEENRLTIGATCEICNYLYHIEVEKKMLFSCKRSFNDGFANLLIAFGLFVCILNLIWIVSKYFESVRIMKEENKGNIQKLQALENQQSINKILIALTSVLGILFFIPMVISIKRAFYENKIISIKFFNIDTEERKSKVPNNNFQQQQDIYLDFDESYVDEFFAANGETNDARLQLDCLQQHTQDNHNPLILSANQSGLNLLTSSMSQSHQISNSIHLQHSDSVMGSAHD